MWLMCGQTSHLMRSLSAFVSKGWCPGKGYTGWKEAESRTIMNLPSHQSRQSHHVILLKYLPAPSQSLFSFQFPLFLLMLFLTLPIHSTCLLRAICSCARMVTLLIQLFCTLDAQPCIMHRKYEYFLPGLLKTQSKKTNYLGVHT